jgi:hypothetical protein
LLRWFLWFNYGIGGSSMSNKHFCQGPRCHEQVTQDRFLKSRGVIRGRYASLDMSYNTERNGYYDCRRNKYFCSQGCEHAWLNEHMQSIEQGRPIEFIRHRRESQGYAKVKNDESRWGPEYSIQRVDNGQLIE